MNTIDIFLEEIKRLKKTIPSDRFLSEYEKGINFGCEDTLENIEMFAKKLKEQTEKKYIEIAKKYNKNYPNDVITKVFGYGNLESWEYDDAEKIFGYACEVVIDKACEWLSEIEDGLTITDVEGLIEDFRKDMIG